MEAFNTNKYPVFEADQVLSQKELNQAVSHLEEQDRIMRKHLTGLGIVCGLALEFGSDGRSVTISCGTAVTSLGFQINWKERMLSHYHNIELPRQFLTPDYIREPHLSHIFSHSAQYEPIKNCVELLPSSSNAEDKQEIPNGFFDDKLLILLLEVALIDQKNCVTTNCDDKGKRMEFNIRPLLVPTSEMPESLIYGTRLKRHYEKLGFPRYNLPFRPLTTGADVLGEFRKAFDDQFLVKLSASIHRVYRDYTRLSDKNFPALADCKPRMEHTIAEYQSTPNIQYLWDWISDLAQAYNEIVEFMDVNPALCCIDEGLFPFHVVLGSNVSQRARTPFLPSFNALRKRQRKLSKLTSLFERLSLIVRNFEIGTKDEIRITPSVYGAVALSEKAIPFYYRNIGPINNTWSPRLTLESSQDRIPSYHATEYSDRPEVKKPLFYDLERYNFFRIEGATGTDYQTAVGTITEIRDQYNLPFKITALNAADFTDKKIDISKFDGRWDDLETDYDIARKRLAGVVLQMQKWIAENIAEWRGLNLRFDMELGRLRQILLQFNKLLPEDLKEFLGEYQEFSVAWIGLNKVLFAIRESIVEDKDKVSVLEEDLVDHIDAIYAVFVENPFKVIDTEAQLRWKSACKDLFFSTFALKHPGLEHKAGVTRGGTFVLVYVDTSIFKTVAPVRPSREDLLVLELVDKEMAVSPKVKKKTEENPFFEDVRKVESANPRLGLVKWQQDETQILSELTEMMKHNIESYYPPEKSSVVFEQVKTLLPTTFDRIKGGKREPYQKLIIADFFLPYACCGKGNTIEMKFENKDSLQIKLDPEQYCNTDKNKHEITVKGNPGGTFTGNVKDVATFTKEGNKHFFKLKRNAAPGTYQMQYAFDGESSNTISVKISAPAAVKWSHGPHPNLPDTFVFTNSIDETRPYEFNFGDGTKALVSEEATHHTFDFQEAKEYTVTIKAIGVCGESHTITVKRRGDFHASDFHDNDFHTN